MAYDNVHLDIHDVAEARIVSRRKWREPGQHAFDSDVITFCDAEGNIMLRLNLFSAPDSLGSSTRPTAGSSTRPSR